MWTIKYVEEMVFVKNTVWGKKFFLMLTLVTILILTVPLNTFADAGDVWIQSSTENLNVNQEFIVSLYSDTGTERLGAYQFSITFDPAMVNVDTTKGTEGVEAGGDGFLTAVNANNENGSLLVNGFDVNGKGPGIYLELLRIHFVALDKAGSEQISIRIDSLTDENGNKIGLPSAESASITIR